MLRIEHFQKRKERLRGDINILLMDKKLFYRHRDKKFFLL